MPGVLFIVNVLRKEYEVMIKKNTQPSYETFKHEQYKKTTNKIQIPISKCTSTECLNTGKIPRLFKTRSENAINMCDISNHNINKKYLKSSWEEMKQTKTLKRNKLKISRPMRGVDIVGAFHWDTPLEIILSEILDRLDVHNVTWNTTKDNTSYQVTFTLESDSLCEELLQVLRSLGFGSRCKSSVSVVPCALSFKSDNLDTQPNADRQNFTYEKGSNSAWSQFSSSVRARTNLAQVIQEVRVNAALTFDWLFLLTVAAFVAAIGLVENSTVIIVASMLISPLMSPITAATLGTAVRDRTLQRMGVKHELLGLFFSLVIGFIFGLVICAIDAHYDVVGEWPTHEMITRCELRSLWLGTLVAIPSGAAVAIAVLGEYTSSLVGVAISASLLPPAVNAGLVWAMALVRLIFPKDETGWAISKPVELAKLGTISLCLTLLNIACIFLTGVVVYKIKEVCPLDRKDISWWRRSSSFLFKPKNLSEKSFPRKTNEINSCNRNPISMSGNPIPKQHLEEDNILYRNQYFFGCYVERPHIDTNYKTNDPDATTYDNKIDEEDTVVM